MSFKNCEKHGKKCYPTRTAAIRAALRFSRARGTALRVYLDPSCGSFHLTKKPRHGWSEVA